MKEKIGNFYESLAQVLVGLGLLAIAGVLGNHLTVNAFTQEVLSWFAVVTGVYVLIHRKK